MGTFILLYLSLWCALGVEAGKGSRAGLSPVFVERLVDVLRGTRWVACSGGGWVVGWVVGAALLGSSLLGISCWCGARK